MEVQCNTLIYSLNLNDNTASVTGLDENTISRDISIPRSIYYESREYIITSIGFNAFSTQDKVKSVILPINSEIQLIDDFAIYLSYLERIEFPMNSKLKIIQCEAFNGCKIKAIRFPPNLEIIDCCAFAECHNLKWVEFPSNSKLKKIKYCSFDLVEIEYFKFPFHLKGLFDDIFDRIDVKKIEIF